MNATMAVQTMVTPTACACTHTWPEIEYSAAVIILPVTQSAVKPGPPSEGALNTPVNSAPSMPPTACTPNTSSESSAPSQRFSWLTPHRHTNPAALPMTKAPGMPTLPAAGVMATSPATTPDAAPSMEGLPLNSHSPKVHASTAQAVARKVFTKASVAELPDSSAEPALNPNHPIHSSEAPIIVIGRLCGVIASLPNPMRLPTR